MFKFGKYIVAVVLAFLMTFAGAVAANAVSDAPTSPVLDRADMFTADQEAALTKGILELQGQYHIIYVVETVAGLNGQEISKAADQRANQLGVGEAGKDNGVFVYISRDDRKIWFAVGTGITPKVSSAQVQSITDNTVLPKLREGDYAGGLLDGMKQIGAAYAGEAPAAAPAGDSQTVDIDWASVGFWTAWILGSLVFIGMIIGVVFGVKAYYDRKARIQREAEAEARRKAQEELNRKRSELATNVFEQIKADGIDFAKLPNKEKRTKVVYSYPQFTEVMEADPGYDYSARVTDMFTRGRYAALPTKSLEESEKIAARQAEERRKEQARQEKIAAKARAEKAKQKDEAKKLWNSLSYSEKEAFKRANGSSGRVQVLDSYNRSGYDTNLLYPFLMAMYFSSVSHSSYSSINSAQASSSSSYSSSSSSSSYSSFDSGMSFGGGGFDGGGGGGSF